MPLARHAWTLGFAVTVVDVRDAYLTADRFPGATLIAAHFSRFADAVTLDARSFALVMNHHIERDRESLRFALDSQAAYIGVLGPRSRYQKLLDGLAAARLRAEPCAARGGSQPGGTFTWRRNRQKRWRCRFSARSSRFGADSTAGS